jgi:S-layer protein
MARDNSVRWEAVSVPHPASAHDDPAYPAATLAVSDGMPDVTSVFRTVVGANGTDSVAEEIVVSGGATVIVTQEATQAVVVPGTEPGAITGNFTVTQAAVRVNGSATTTAVVVNQTADVASKPSVNASAEVMESSSVKFEAMKAGDAITLDMASFIGDKGLTFTAAKDLTAAQVAEAFAHLSVSANQGYAPVSSGSYSGFFPRKNWVSGAATDDTVVFTNVNKGDRTDLSMTATGTGTAPTVTKLSDGAVGSSAVAGVGGISTGVVTVTDQAYGRGGNSITSVTLNAYASGASIQSDALTTLSLSNAVDARVIVANHTAAHLDLTTNNLKATTAGLASTLDLDHAGASYTSLALHSTGASSTTNISAAGVLALTIDGTMPVDLTGSTLTGLTTVIVSGSAGVNAGTSFSGANVADVNAAATSGNVTAVIDAGKARYEGGAGIDTVTLSSTALTRTVTLGEGNDILLLKPGTALPTAAIDGGAGQDTLAMRALDAAAATVNTAFSTKVTGFEKLSLDFADKAAVIDLANLNNLHYVISANAAWDAAVPEGNTLVLKNMANDGTLELTNPGLGATVMMQDSAGADDSFHLAFEHNSNNNADYGYIDVAGVESISLSVHDTHGREWAEFPVVGTAAVSIIDADLKTVTLRGDAAFAFRQRPENVALTTIDASAMSGALSCHNGFGTTALTIKGGSAADSLGAGHAGDVLIGGAGNDSLQAPMFVANVTLTGGAGADTFFVSSFQQDVHSYATITDLSPGDRILFGTATAFIESKIIPADTATFQHFADAAISQTHTGDLAWFQFQGNTYMVDHISSGSHTFVDSSDGIIKITGMVDMSQVSFNSYTHTLLVC